VSFARHAVAVVLQCDGIKTSEDGTCHELWCSRNGAVC